ncbi:MAG: hypothetical protein HY901_30770 [Deltaproteobacteria bacterium]|nr:hypothetical protein [Deltaproteobacteria bacterium]
MSWLHPTLAHALHAPAPFSFWRAALQRRAGARPLQDWLVEQANLRGFLGAYNRQEPSGALDGDLTLEDIVVALCAPQAPAEGRVFKLVLRILQSGRLDLRHLAWLARREMATPVLWWLLERIPDAERTPPVQATILALGGPPRGYRGLDYDYDPQRLVRRPYQREQPWRTPHR